MQTLLVVLRPPMAAGLLTLALLMHASLAPGFAATAEEMIQIKQHMAAGQRAFERGALDQAAVDWRKAAESYAAQGHRAKQIDALVLAAEAYQALGQYPAALRALAVAHRVATEIDDKGRMAAVTGSLGKLYYLSGSVEQAGQYFERSLALARESGNMQVRSQASITWANS